MLLQDLDGLFFGKSFAFHLEFSCFSVYKESYLWSWYELLGKGHLTDGRLLRTFNVFDNYNREGLGIDVDLSLQTESPLVC